MAEENKQEQSVVPSEYNLDAKWDACLDLGLRRFTYFSLIGGFAGLLLFRSPVTRWASTAFGAGAGLGSAYTECSQKFGGYPGKSTASISETPITKCNIVVNKWGASFGDQDSNARRQRILGDFFSFAGLVGRVLVTYAAGRKWYR